MTGMYYRDCTSGYAICIIEEIIENSGSDKQALDLIQAFLNNEVNTDELDSNM